MRSFVLPLLLLPLAAAAPVPGDQDRDSVAAWHATRQGKLLKLKEIERRVVPGMEASGAQYIGFDLELPSGVYTLKFLRDGNVIWVDVDGRTGNVIGRTGR